MFNIGRNKVPQEVENGSKSVNTQAELLLTDTAAGLTTAVMLVPQGMAYAMLAGLPPIMGLYASIVPLLLYAALGTSRQLAIGPMALASLLVASGIQEINGGPDGVQADPIVLGILITLVAGIFQIGMGLFRMGGLVNLLSHPVVSGFTTAAALIIGTSQLQHVVGFEVPSGSVFNTFAYIVGSATSINHPTLAIGLGAIVLITLLQRLAPRVPASLVAVVLGIGLSYQLDLASVGVSTLGEIPSGLPVPSVPEQLNSEMIERILPVGLAIALIGFMESISAAKVYARQYRYDISPSRELVAMGVANVSSSVFGGYVVGGALSRTAVNAAAGAQSRFAGVITAGAVLLVLTVLTAPFAYLPKAVLAAIILVAVVKLIDVNEVYHLWKIKRDDLVILVVTFLATLTLSVESGILIGVGASLLWLVYSTTRPTVAVLGRLPGTRSFRCVDHFPDAETFERIIIIRMDAQFFFGNVVHLKEAILRITDEDRELSALVMDASSMNALDSTAADTLEEIIKELRRKRIEIMVSHVKGSVLNVMEHSGLLELLGDGHVFYEVEDAVQAALRHRQAVLMGVPAEAEEYGTSDMLD